jgi:hypothetical protein
MQFQFKDLKGSLEIVARVLRGVKVNVPSSWEEHHFPIQGFVSADDGVAPITPIANNIAVRFIDWVTPITGFISAKGGGHMRCASLLLPTHSGQLQQQLRAGYILIIRT